MGPEVLLLKILVIGLPEGMRDDPRTHSKLFAHNPGARLRFYISSVIIGAADQEQCSSKRSCVSTGAKQGYWLFCCQNIVIKSQDWPSTAGPATTLYEEGKSSICFSGARAASGLLLCFVSCAHWMVGAHLYNPRGIITSQ